MCSDPIRLHISFFYEYLWKEIISALDFVRNCNQGEIARKTTIAALVSHPYMRRLTRLISLGIVWSHY